MNAIRGDKSFGDIRRAGHQPDWEPIDLLWGETNEMEPCREPDTTSQTGRHMSCYKRRHPESRATTVRRETHELETSGEPDTTSQTGRQMNCYKGRQMNWRHPGSRTPPARLGDKWIAVRADKWIGDIRRAGHHQPDWEPIELLKGDEMETCREPTRRHPESRTPPARLGDAWIAVRGDKWIGGIRRAWIAIRGDTWIGNIPRAGHHQPDWETNGVAWIAVRGDKWIGGIRRAWIAIRGDTWIGDIRRAGPDQPDWETNKLWYEKERHMNWRHPESRTPPLGQSRTPI